MGTKLVFKGREGGWGWNTQEVMFELRDKFGLTSQNHTYTPKIGLGEVVRSSWESMQFEGFKIQFQTQFPILIIFYSHS